MDGQRRGTKALELWCRRMVEGYKNVRVDNMTTSWRDGLAFCALVSKCASLKPMSKDLIHFEELKRENVYQNNELAFRVAEEYLGIPALLDPQDMADYEVPDKLSILTYLSQFYQVFGAQENSLRLKRSSTSEANKSSPTTPPAKMANVVPRREPCVKCNNPVFFAERLVINESLYHRTCFRCARCSSVLTLGNFYETEKDHEFCCETCPDEEKKPAESNRLSIAQKIALFERDTSSVLKKSLSDEEKSKSLSRQKPVHSDALNGFLAAQITPEQEASEDEKTIDSLSTDSDSEDEAQTAIKPPLPADNPPKIVEKPLISGKPHVEISDDHKVISETLENFVVTKELTHDADTEAIASVADTHTESQDQVAYVVDKKVPEDDIESLFELLAEDAVATSFAPMPVVTKKVSVPPVQKAQHTPVTAPEVAEITQILEEKTDIEVAPDKEGVGFEKPAEVKPEIEVAPDKEGVESDKPAEVKPDSIEMPLPAIDEPEKTDKTSDEAYPDDLDPFGGDDEGPAEVAKPEPSKRPSLNPFGDCSDDEDEVPAANFKRSYGTLPKPPRPPPPKALIKPVSTNPFGSDDEADEPEKLPIRTPVPTPRKPMLHSATPEPSPRSRSNNNSPGHSFKGSTSSLASSGDGMSLRRKKKKAPAPPPPALLLNGSDTIGSNKTTPKKKRPAPTPPTSTPKRADPAGVDPSPSLYITASDFPQDDAQTEASESISTLGSISTIDSTSTASHASLAQPNRRLIPLEESLIEEGTSVKPTAPPSEETVTYRRKIIPLSPSSTEDRSFENLEQSKDNKEAQNRQRQSQSSLMSNPAGSESTDSLPYLNKSSQGKWKRRKGPAPALPGFAQLSHPQRRVLQMLPLQEIRSELEVIEVQQQGLEKQGVMLEKMIRERCEGSADNRTTEELLQTLPPTKNPKEVEELILQLFELVNEKNELFRRQAELMYLRRAHRLEEEQADVEYEIRTLMAQPEQNKTDSDKAKEEALIARLVEIVTLRNEVVDTLDRDRLREAEEDLSIKQRMESHTAKLDQDYLANLTPTKLSKKEKKKLKEAKKLKNKKLDADKDLDTSEIKSETAEKKKKKKKFLF